MVATVGAWIMLPSFQGSQRAVNAEAGQHLERARRLLHQYSYGTTHIASVLDQLYQAGVDVDLEDEDALSHDFLDEYQAVHEGLWALYQPTDWQADPPQAERAGYGNLESQIDQAVDARKTFASDNADLLDQADSAIREALAVSSGSASASDHAEANRLHAVIAFHKGLADATQAIVVRAELAPARQALADLLPRSQELQTLQQQLGSLDNQEDLKHLQTRLAQIDTSVRLYRDQLATVEGHIGSLETSWKEATAQLDEASKELALLRASGIDFSDANGGEKFEAAVMEQSRRYRDADRRVRSLEVGSYRDAMLNRPGDFVGGTYVSASSEAVPTVELGLTHYRSERDLLESQIADAAQSKEWLIRDIADLEQLGRRQQAEADQAGQQLAQLKTQSVKAFDELNRIESEAYALEETALEQFKQAGRFARDASTAAGRWVSDAQTLTQSLSPEAQSRSPFDLLSKARWIGANMTAQVADANMAQAAIYYRRFASASRAAALLDEVVSVLGAGEADPSVEREKKEEAKTLGTEAITQAMDQLQRAYRDGQKHWTFVAQQAGADELMALFGLPGYDQDALQAYRSAIKGRETEAFTKPFVERVKQLENK